MAEDQEKAEEQKGPELKPVLIDVGSGVKGVVVAAALAADTVAKEGEAAGGAGKEKAEEPPVVIKHEITVNGMPLRYTVTAGLLPIKNDKNETEATVFFMAYTRDDVGQADERPLMFSFNGGPGSASVWLHLGALGPKRVQMLEDGSLPPPPYRMVDNEFTWLVDTDLVFIDPVGTGYSRPAKPDLGKKFWGLKGDIESVGEFIRLYLTRYERWSSPLFMVGESYGTTRAAGLSGYLVEHGIAFNGIMLISSIMNFQTSDFAAGNDLPYVLFLPSYADIAWYHKKLGAEFPNLAKLRAEVEPWAIGPYAEALAKGDQLTPQQRADVVDHLARYTGLKKEFIEQHNLRISEPQFTRELLRDQNKIVGRLDGRFIGDTRES